MSFEWRKRRVEQGEPDDSGTFRSMFGRGVRVLASLRKEKPERIEKGVLAGIASAASEFRGRGEPVKAEELVGKIISGLPQEQFPGIKSLQESDPEAIRELAGELLSVVNTDDDVERRRKSEEIIEKYNIIGNNGREIRQILGVVGSLREGLPPDGFSAEELGEWQKTLEDAQGRAGGVKEKLRSGGGFMLKFLLFTTMFMVFLQYKLMKYALEKAVGAAGMNIKSKKQK